MSQELKRSVRSDEDYVVDALRRGLKVMEALEGTNFEPISTSRIAARTGLSYDFCFRALRTLKIAGFATESPKGWQAGPKLLRFSDRFTDLCLATIHAQDSEISES